MKMPAYKKKAAICLASGDTEGDTAQQVNVDVSIIHKWLGEDDFNAYLNSLKRELKPEPERTVLKWTKFYEKDQRTHPADGQKVLVCSFHGCDAVCNFEKTYKIFVTTENNSVLDKVYAWMSVPSPHFVDDMGITYVDAEINNEYLIEQTTLETFDIIDAITPALREAVKHLLVQQGANK
jgi:hypothetical protein